jgi:hypothetical protein
MNLEMKVLYLSNVPEGGQLVVQQLIVCRDCSRRVPLLSA